MDPRILRSRRMLMDALAKLLREKEFEQISVQEIADEATLNRATFYLHYQDKAALLQAMTESRFRELIASRGISSSTCEGAIRAIALGICDYLAASLNCPAQCALVPLEGSIIPIVEAMFKDGFERRGTAPGIDAGILATAAAWAAFGAARRWSQTPNPMPAEQMADKIESIIKPILAAGAS